MKIIDCIQGTEPWYAARRGLVTASEIDKLITPKWKVRTGDGPEKYLFQKLAEKSVGWTPDSFQSRAMDAGNIAEKVALPWFNFTYNSNARAVGFCLGDDLKTGCSPDGLIGEHSGLELKHPIHPTHLQYLSDGVVPDDYVGQVQFSMYVTGRKEWEFVSWSKVFDALRIQVKIDPVAQAAIAEALDGFFKKFDPLLAKLRGALDQEAAEKEAAYQEKIRKWETGGPIP